MRDVDWNKFMLGSVLCASLGIAVPTAAQAQAHSCIQGLGIGNQQIWWTGGSDGKYLMDFTGGAPVLSRGSIGQTSSFEGTAVYTTPDGDLLLYTDGNSIFNGQTNALIGTGVGGNPSATEAALIVPQPGGVSTNDFYVFGNTANTSGPVNYTLVDIAGASIGAITPLDGGLVFSESLATVPHGNGTEFWIIAVTNASPTVNAYLVTDAGVGETPVSSAIPGLPGSTSANRGAAVYHPPTGKLAIGFYSESTGTGYIFTGQFDENTGAVTDFTQQATGALGYGVAFSPDGSKLYYSVGTEGYRGAITHYDIASATATTIQSGSWAMPRLAPDNKVYVVAFRNTTMGVVNSPDSAFASIDWDPTGVSLPASSSAAFSLVNQTYASCNILNDNLPPTASFTFNCTELQCSFDGSTSTDSDGTITNWTWDFGDGGSGSGENTVHEFATAGLYPVTLTVTDNDGATDDVQQNVNLGSSVSESVVPVPTLDRLGLLVLLLVAGLTGAAYLRRY